MVGRCDVARSGNYSAFFVVGLLVNSLMGLFFLSDYSTIFECFKREIIRMDAVLIILTLLVMVVPVAMQLIEKSLKAAGKEEAARKMHEARKDMNMSDEDEKEERSNKPKEDPGEVLRRALEEQFGIPMNPPLKEAAKEQSIDKDTTTGSQPSTSMRMEVGKNDEPMTARQYDAMRQGTAGRTETGMMQGTAGRTEAGMNQGTVRRDVQATEKRAEASKRQAAVSNIGRKPVEPDPITAFSFGQIVDISQQGDQTMSERSKVLIDKKKLIIYSAIMEPKFKEA